MSEFKALCMATDADLSVAGILADWLDEHDRPRLATLLRRRWKRWQTDRAKAERTEAELVAECREFIATEIGNWWWQRKNGIEVSWVRGRDLSVSYRYTPDWQFRSYFRRRFGKKKIPTA